MNTLNYFKSYVISGIRVFLCVFIFMLISSIPVYSLDWNDKEWIEAGCPFDIFGKWVSVGVDVKNKKLLSIDQNKIRVLRNQTLEQEYLFKTKDMHRDASFINLKLLPSLNGNKKNLYLKIRPHLVHTKIVSKKLKVNIDSCLIKVFEFESKKSAELNKYLNWGIYKLKK